MTATVVAAWVVICAGVFRCAVRSLHRRRVVARITRPVARERRAPAPSWVEAAMVDADLTFDAASVWRAWIAAAFIVPLVAGATLGLAAGAVALLGCGVGPVVVARARRGRADERVEHELPGALEAVARSLRSGASLRMAVGEAAGATCGRLAADLTAVARQAEHGTGLVEALDRWAVDRPSPGVHLAVSALALAAETGGTQARAVDGVAASLRERLGAVAEARAQSAQVRASVLVIALSPVAFCAFSSATDPRTGRFLFRTPLGAVFLAGGALLDAAAALWMRRLARVDV